MMTATATGAIRRLPTIARIALSSAGSCQNGATSAGTAIQVANTLLNARLSSVKRQSLPRDVEAEVGHRQRHRDERRERGGDETEREQARREEAERARKRRTEHLTGDRNALDLRVVADAEIRRAGARVDGVQRRRAGDDDDDREQAPDDAEVLHRLPERLADVGRRVAGVAREIAVGQEHRGGSACPAIAMICVKPLRVRSAPTTGRSGGNLRHQAAAERDPRPPVEQPLDRDDDEADEDDEQQRRHDLLDALVAAEHGRDDRERR